MKTLLEKIAVMQAAADGKETQWRRLPDGKWHNAGTIELVWNWYYYDYRVKPREPKVIYVNEYEHFASAAHLYKDHAIRTANSTVVRKAVKYQEVIED